MKPLETRESRTASRGIFEKIYEDYNRREYVSPDPLQFLYDYEDTVDREAVGLIASGLAYGRVAHILKSVSRVLDTLGPHPAEYLKGTSYRDHEAALCGFVHRFTGCAEICAFLDAIGAALREHGSIENLFLAGWRGDMAEAMENLALAFCRYTGQDNLYLLPRPSKGSACKRVDPGGWHNVSPADLLIPLDTHMFNISSTLGLCSMKSASGKAAAEITRKWHMER